MIIVSAPGNVPVASVATPILNIPTATSSEQQRSHNPVTLGSETVSVTTNQTRTTVNVVQSNQQMVKAVIRPSTSNTSVDRSENYGMPNKHKKQSPRGKLCFDKHTFWRLIAISTNNSKEFELQPAVGLITQF